MAVMTLRRGSDFTPLTRAVQAAGLLRRRRIRYTFSIAANVLAVAGIWVGVFLVGASWWAMLLTIPAALFTVWTCFFGHDACHQQIARTKRGNYALGLLHGNVGVGMSYRWWADKHNRHHANPNQVGKDPDVGAGALVWTPEQARRRGRARWLARHQNGLSCANVTLVRIECPIVPFAGGPAIVRSTLPGRQLN